MFEEARHGVPPVSENYDYFDCFWWPAFSVRRVFNRDAKPQRTVGRNFWAEQNLSLYRRSQEVLMDWNRIEGNWKQAKGKVKEKWGKLTDDDLTAINGKRDQLEGRIQERYGIARDQVRKDVDTWYDSQTW
jgi:uncharacterized protein YjbJ (UPF0337 family)